MEMPERITAILWPDADSVDGVDMNWCATPPITDRKDFVPPSEPIHAQYRIVKKCKWFVNVRGQHCSGCGRADTPDPDYYGFGFCPYCGGEIEQ